MKKIIVLIIVCCCVLSGKPDTDNLYLGDFDSPGSQYDWKLVKDADAMGKLDYTPGYRGLSAHIVYDVSKGGRCVGLQKELKNVPPNAVGVRLSVKCSGAATAWLYLIDSQGARYEYRLTRSLSDLDDSQWFSRTVSFQTVPDSLRKGKYDPGIGKNLKSIRLVIEPRMDPWYPKNRWFPQPKGEVWFDDVLWVTNYDEPLQLLDKAQYSVSASDLWKRTGVCTHFESGDFRLPDSVKSVGFQAVRGDLLWNKIEKVKGSYDFTYADSMVREAEKRGIRTLFILCYSNPLYTTHDAPPQSEEQIQAYARYCSETVRYFKGRAVDFEIWNEPNLINFWKPSPDAGKFSRLLKVAVDSVTKANPSANVITGGTAGIDWRFIDSLGICNALKNVTALGIHPYRAGSPESFSEDLICLRWLAKKYFKNYPPEWATECGTASSNYGDGYSLPAQQWQARIDIRTILANWQAGFTYSMKYEFFTFGTNSKDPECNYGIITPALEPRPSYIAIQTLNRMTGNRQWVGRLKTLNSGAYALQFNGKTDKLLILWTSVGKLHNDSTGFKTRFLLPEKPSVLYDIFGKELKMPERVNGKWPIETDGQIVYAVLPNK